MRFALPDGQTVMIDQPFDMAGIQYPDNWLRLLTPSERLAFGAVELPEPPTFDGRYYSAPGVPHPLDQCKAQKRSEVAAKRWERENAGVKVGGKRFASDERTRTVLIGARIMAKEDPAYATDWKFADGFVALSATELVAAADAVGAHVRSCFAAEKAHVAAIDALTDQQAVIDYDATAGWPG
jgi:hypothetical protein